MHLAIRRMNSLHGTRGESARNPPISAQPHVCQTTIYCLRAAPIKRDASSTLCTRAPRRRPSRQGRLSPPIADAAVPSPHPSPVLDPVGPTMLRCIRRHHLRRNAPEKCDSMMRRDDRHDVSGLQASSSGAKRAGRLSSTHGSGVLEPANERMSAAARRAESPSALFEWALRSRRKSERRGA